MASNVRLKLFGSRQMVADCLITGKIIENRYYSDMWSGYC